MKMAASNVPRARARSSGGAPRSRRSIDDAEAWAAQACKRRGCDDARHRDRSIRQAARRCLAARRGCVGECQAAARWQCGVYMRMHGVYTMQARLLHERISWMLCYTASHGKPNVPWLYATTCHDGRDGLYIGMPRPRGSARPAMAVATSLAECRRVTRLDAWLPDGSRPCAKPSRMPDSGTLDARGTHRRPARTERYATTRMVHDEMLSRGGHAAARSA